MAILNDQRLPDPGEPEVGRELADALSVRASQALVLTGVRRSGKSVLQSQLMRRQRGAFYCNLEDTRLFDFSVADFPTFIALVEEHWPPHAAIFLDEVQEVAEWQRLVRSLLDLRRAICITGSNASLLGRELGAKLTGRHRSFEVFPFNYGEYLAYTGRQPGAESLGGFIDEGGFPMFLHDRDPLILQELLRDIVQRDVAARYGLRETRHVMNLVLFLFGHTGQPFSMQKLTKALAIPTVSQTSRYLEFLQDAYLLFALPKFSTSFKQRVVTPNKYYAIDNGLRRANSQQMSPDVGRRLENAVFLALRGRGEALAYASEKDLWECDFVTDSEVIQVCAELTPSNQRRELEGLIRAAELPGRRRPVVITLNQRDRLAHEGVTIEVLPAWEWLSSKP